MINRQLPHGLPVNEQTLGYDPRVKSVTVKKTEFDEQKNQLRELKEEINERFQLVADDMVNIRQDCCHNTSNTQRLDERINVHDIRAKKFSFIKEGFPEAQNENVAANLTMRLNTDANANLSATNFQTIRRVGKADTNNRGKTGPRPIALVAYDEDTRSRLLSCRGNLSKIRTTRSFGLTKSYPLPTAGEKPCFMT